MLESSNEILKFYEFCLYQNREEDITLNKNAAYCFPCMLKIFGNDTEFNFQKALIHLSKEQNDEVIRKIVGAQIHEIFKICIENDWCVFDYAKPLINTLKSESKVVFTSPLENLSMTIQVLNLNFKQKLVGTEMFEPEKFSLKEAQRDDEIEKLANILWDLTLSLLQLEQSMMETPLKFWREIKMFYEHISKAVVGSDGDQQEMPYFMINKLCTGLLDRALDQITIGAHQVRFVALDLVSVFTTHIASSIMRK